MMKTAYINLNVSVTPEYNKNFSYFRNKLVIDIGRSISQPTTTRKTVFFKEPNSYNSNDIILNKRFRGESDL